MFLDRQRANMRRIAQPLHGIERIRLGSRRCAVRDHDASRGFQNSAHFPKHRERIDKVVKCKAGAGDRETFVGKRQRQYVALAPGDIREPALMLQLPSLLQHGGRQVDPGCVPGDASKSAHQQARATRDVEYRVIGTRFGHFHNSFQSFLIADGGSSGKRHGLARELIENTCAMGGTHVDNHSKTALPSGWMTPLRFSGLLFLFGSFATAQTPAVTAGGVVNAASFDSPVAPGSLISIFGANLASQTAVAGVIPLPKSLAGVSVTFNSIAAPLLFVSDRQINAQLPWEVSASSPVNVVVNNNGALSTPQTVAIASIAPGVFAVQGHAIAIHPDGSLAAPAGSINQFAGHPAAAGETLIVLANGLGPVNPPAVTGDNSLDALRTAVAVPQVFIGGVAAQVSFSGLSPQFVGVNQINLVVPSNISSGDAVPLEIRSGGRATAPTTIAVSGVTWTQWGQNPRHTSSVPIVGQDLGRIIADIVYDPLAEPEKEIIGDLLSHYQVPLVDGNDVFMEFKNGVFDGTSTTTQNWGETRFAWRNDQLVPIWSYTSDWKPPGSLSDFFEPVFHAVLANGSVYVPGAHGRVIQLDRANGAVIRAIAPFGDDPNTYEAGPITADVNGNLFYNVIQVAVDPLTGFYGHDTVDSWLVRVAPTGTFSIASYKTLLTDALPADGRCLGSFPAAVLPWPPSPTAVPGSSPCGTARVGLNIAPAIAPDGTIYSIARAHFNGRYGFLVAINPDLSKKWVASLRDRFQDGCGVPVSQGGWLPPNNAPGGCRTGAPLGVNPSTNRFGDGEVVDSASSSPTVAPDGSILYGSYSRYNYAQGHLMRFDASGQYLGAFGFGWDYTPAIYSHDGTWSIIIKNNHYGIASYCGNDTFCPPDRTANNPASPEEYLVTQVSPDMKIEWSFKSANTQSCSRNPDGTLRCISDHPHGFEWCVNAPVVDANGVVYANSEDGNLYAIGQGGGLKQRIFQQLAIGAAYTPASLGPDGKVYTQNDGHLFVVGK
jgi:uncharacterized protein (TIGR03437 family)